MENLVHLSRGGPPKKEYIGLIRSNKELFPIFCKHRVLKLRFLAFPGGPGGFREVREAARNHFRKSYTKT